MHSKLFRRAIVPAFATALVAGAVAAPAGAKTTDSALADRGPLVINEIDSNDDDWVEIFNTTSQTIPLAGWVLEDRNKDTDTHELADVAAVIPPFGFIVIDPNVNLNKDGEEVVLKDPDGKISDSFQWTKAGDGPDFHRCADGTGDMVQLPSGNSKGTWNCPDKIIDFLNARSDNAIAQAGSESIVINEIATKGTEFVELANKGHEDVDISGWVLFDSGDGAQNQPFVIPSGTKVPAGEYYVATTGSNFGFDGNDGVTVYDASGKKVDSHSWTSHPNDGESWSRLDDMTGAFTSNQLTQGAKNVAPAQVDPKNIVINEVVSNGDPVSDWVELYNKGTAPIDISGWKVIDNDPTHTPIVIPNGTVVQPGDFYAFYTDGAANTPDKSKGFGLGKGDSVTISDANGVEIDSVGWSNGAHATPWGRQPDGTGEFTDLGSNNVKPTRGTTNSSDSNPTTPSTSGVVINEVESNGDPLDDWVELYNMGSDAVDISGWQLTDKGGLSKHKVTIPDGTILQPGEFIAFYVDALAGAGNNGFGLGEADEAVLYDNKGNQIDRIDWTSHSKRTLGRLPDGTGEFSETGKPTRGAANLSPDEVIWAEEPWPFDPQNVDNVVLGADFQIDDTSGVDFDSDGRAWVVNNKTGTLWAFDYNDGKYVAAGSWQLRYPNDNAGQPDAEGVTIGKDGAIYVATERDTRSDDTKKVSRPSVLRFDIPAGTGGTLMATNEWNLKNVVGLVGPNSGLEAIEYIPEQDLYAVGVEATGEVIFLKPNFTEAEIERYKAPFENVMALDYNAVSQELRVVCDEVCDGASIAVKYAQTKFEPVGKAQFDPEKMPEGAANEGFATFTDVGECVQGKKTLTTRFLWADDGLSDNSTALRAASSEETEDCTAPTTTVTAGATTATVATSTVTVPAATTTFTPVTTVADTAVTATETAATSTVKTAGATTTETPVTTVADTAVTATETAATSTVKTAGATTTETPVTTVADTAVTATKTAATSTVKTAGATTTETPVTTVADTAVTATETAATSTVKTAGATTTETPVTTVADTAVTATETAATSTVKTAGATTTETPVTTVADTAVTATETAATSTVKTAGATTTETPVTTVADTAVTATKTAATSTVKTAGATETKIPVTTVTDPEWTVTEVAATSTVKTAGATTTETPVTTVADTAVTATETAATSTVKTAGATTTETPVTTVADTAVTATETAPMSTVKTAGATTTETPVTTVADTAVTATETAATSTVKTAGATTTETPVTTVADTAVTATETAATSTVKTAGATTTETPVTTVADTAVTATKTAATSTVKTAGATTTETPVTTVTSTNVITSTGKTSTVTSTVEDTKVLSPLTTVAKPLTTTVTPTTTVNAETVTLTAVAATETETPAAVTVTAETPTVAVETPALSVNAPVIVEAVPDATINIPVQASDPQAVKVQGLPEGMAYNPESGAITGSAAAGAYDIAVTQGEGENRLVAKFELRVGKGLATTVTTTSEVPSTGNQSEVDAGSSLDGKCVAALAGWMVPLVALVPLGIASQIELPLPAQVQQMVQGLQEQAARMLPPVDPEIQMLAGGLAAATLGILAIVSIVNACSGGGSSTGSSNA